MYIFAVKNQFSVLSQQNEVCGKCSRTKVFRREKWHMN